MKKLILLIIILNLSLVSAFDMDLYPTISLDVSDTGNGIKLDVVAGDFLDNAGLEWIEVYENDVLISNNDIISGGNNPKDCNLASSCNYILTKKYPSTNSNSYYAKTMDKSGQEKTSDTKTLNLYPVIVSGPTVNYIDQTSVQINWDTNEESTDRIKSRTSSGVYGPFENEDPDTDLDQTTHSVTLTNLNEGKTYYYIIESIDVDPLPLTSLSREYSFNINDITAPIINNIQEVNVGYDSVRITWDTSEDSTSKVDYGLSTSYTDVEQDLSYVTNHDILLDNLQDGETYYYEIESVDRDGNGVLSAGSFSVGRFIISFSEPDDGDEFYVGDTIEGEIRIENTGSSDVDVDIEIVLYDETEDDEIEEIELDNKEIEAGESEDFEFEFELPYSLDEGNSYTLYVEVDGSYRQEIGLDLDRKDHDVVIDDLRVYSLGKNVDVNVDIYNRGRKDEEDVYVELKVYGAGLNMVSERFDLESWDESGNRMSKRFSFERPSEGSYTVEASVFFGSRSVYKTEDFKVEEFVEQDNTKLISGNIGVSSLESVSSSEREKLGMWDVSVALVDFLLLIVVIYGIVWLIKK